MVPLFSRKRGTPLHYSLKLIRASNNRCTVMRCNSKINCSKQFFRHVIILAPIVLFISRDTCSDSIAKLFRTCFYGVSHNYRAICCKMGYRTYVSVRLLSAKGGGVSHRFGEALTSLKNYRAMWGIAAILSQYRAVWGH